MCFGDFLTTSMDPTWPVRIYNEPASQVVVTTGRSVTKKQRHLSKADGSCFSSIEKTNSSHANLEPTPLGPMGVETVVSSISLTGSRFAEEDVIHSVLGTHQASEVVLPSAGSKRSDRLVSSSSEPSLKKHRSSGCVNSMNANTDITRLKQRASWTAPCSMGDSRFLLSVRNMLNEGGGDDGGDDDDDDNESKVQFKPYQSEHWVERFADLGRFRAEKGHCFVPHSYAENPALAQWVKRQRYQYKLKQDGRHTTLTEQRQAQLEAMGFVWDSHKAIWEERYRVLAQFRMLHGHSNVPSNFPEDKSLAIWVKCKSKSVSEMYAFAVLLLLYSQQ